MPRKNTPQPLEERIENQIAFFLENNGVAIKKIISEGFFDEKRGVYRKRKSPYSKPGISDLCGTLPNGRALWIEVKKPSEMKFFDRPAHVIEKDVYVATYEKGLKPATLKKYQHALEQARFIENEIKHGAVAFYASSVAEVIKKLKDFGYEFS